jgi:hypothetical protein
MDASKPLLSGTAALVVGTIGGLAATASAFVPAPWGALVMVLGFVACVVAGVASPMPKFAAGKPVLQGTALVGALAVSGLVEQLYTSLPAGWPQGLALGVAGLLAFLTGKAAPGPMTAGPSPVEVGAAAGAEVKTSGDAVEVFRKGPPAP